MTVPTERKWLHASCEIPSFSFPWWRHDIETLSILLALCRENPLLIHVFPSPRTMNAELWRFLDSLKNHENKQLVFRVAWWRHQMVDFPSKMSVTRSVDVFFDLRLNKRLSKQSRRRRFQMPSLWHHFNIMDRDFRRRGAHVAAPYWGHVSVITNQGKCFPNFI